MDEKLKTAAHLYDRVPPDWYETSVRVNPFQRYWHQRRFQEVGREIEPVSGRVLDIGSADGFFTHEIARAGFTRVKSRTFLLGMLLLVTARKPL